jgi:hypothetical protein
LYLNYLARFLRRAAAGAGLANEMEGPIPEHLRKWWTPDLNCLHSADWWSKHWQRSGAVDVELADTLAGGWRLWADWHKIIAPGNEDEIRAVEADAGRNLGYVRTVARRRAEVDLSDPPESVSAEYSKKPMLR